MLFTTPAGFRNWAGLGSDTSKDTQYQAWIQEISFWFEHWCNRIFANQSYTEYYNGSGTQHLYLRQRPVTAITNIWQDDLGLFGQASGSFDPTLSVLQNGVDYVMHQDQPDGSSLSGIVIMVNGVWPKRILRKTGLLSPYLGPSIGNIKVQYTAGFNQVPPDLELAANLALNWMRQYVPFGRFLTHESYEERNVSYVIYHKSIFDIVGIFLAKYKNSYYTWIG